ncbi:Cation transporter (fragment) [Hyella patelloides LEGE 07179]|uniref:Cation transporter n=1 Tax=Hyella patelloides LEGE 07179 TaxID=945734 RepID=A0A563W5M4_9CYAN
MLLPDNAVSEADYWQGDRRKFLSDSQIKTIALFVFLYFLLFIVGVIITAAYGYSLPESLFEYASTLSTVGLSVGVTSADAPVGLLWTQIIGMFLGRLEFFTVFIGTIRLCQDAFPVIFGKKQ